MADDESIPQNDLVINIRRLPATLIGSGDGEKAYFLAHEAADEIERLRRLEKCSCGKLADVHECYQCSVGANSED